MTQARVSAAPRKRQPDPEPVAQGDPCANCNATGLVYGGPKYRKTCQVCQGAKYKVVTK